MTQTQFTLQRLLQKIMYCIRQYHTSIIFGTKYEGLAWKTKDEPENYFITKK